jgi:hypothetical protein
MADWATRGYAVTALAIPVGETYRAARGMALAIRYKQAAYYASGATLDDNLSHALIWHLMTTLRCGGLEQFEVGWGPRVSDTPKDLSIAFFKQGFGGAVQQVVAVETAL